MSRIKTQDGTELYVKDWGTGRPVILLHGWPLSADMWDAQMLHLANSGFRAVAYDRRGFGRSDQPWNGYNYDTFASDLSDVIEALDLRDAVLVGFSMGGGEAVRYPTNHGTQRVSKVALVAAVTPYLLKTDGNDEGAPPAAFKEIKDGVTKDRAAFFTGFAKKFFNAGMLSGISDELIETSREIANQASLKGTLDCVDAFSATDFRPDLAQLKVPCLVIHGDKDQIVPMEISGKRAAKQVAHAELKVYSGAPHGLHVTHRDELNADLARFAAS